MLTDKGIRQAVEKGSLKIEPFEEGKVRPCSYDLTVERIVSPGVKGAAPDLMDCGMEEFIDRHCEPYGGVLRPGKQYIGVSRERVSSDLLVETVMRSSAARHGIYVAQLEPVDPSHLAPLYFQIHTFGTECAVGEGQSLVQLIAEAGIPVQGKELEEVRDSISPGMEVVHEKGVFFPGSHWQTSEMLLLHLGNPVQRYNGKTLVYGQDNSSCFEERDMTAGYELEPGRFYIGFTQEDIRLPATHAGIFRRLLADVGIGYVHPNAPLVLPGSAGNQVLEMWYPLGRKMEPGLPICGLEIHWLNQPPENSYSGKYKGQKGPQLNIPEK